MSGWVVGYIIGGVVVVLVVALLLTMIVLAGRAIATAGSIIEQLGRAHRNTLALWEIRTTNATISRINTAASTARRKLE